MELRRYLFENRITATAFCKMLGCSRIHLSGIVNGRRIPSLLLATSIQRVTEGKVTVEELMTPTDVPKLTRELKENFKRKEGNEK